MGFPEFFHGEGAKRGRRIKKQICHPRESGDRGLNAETALLTLDARFRGHDTVIIISSQHSAFAVH
jgi:hypothetical protein